MRTKSVNQPKVNVITLGCSKNTVDSEVLMAQLQSNKFDVAHESQDEDADIVIINTCGFIDSAVQESLDAIGEALHENGKVVVSGPVERLRNDADVQRFYLGYSEGASELASFREVKHYKRRKRWLS